MPKTIETTVYTFDELEEKAKEKARDWWRQGGLDFHDWHNATFEDAANIGLELKEFEIDSASYVRNLTGSLTLSPREVAEKIKAEHGYMCQTHINACDYIHALERLKEPPAGDGEERGIYEQERQELDDNFLARLIRNYTELLQQELEYLDSNDHIDEVIRANEYTFTVDGKRFG